jgi:spore coat polysaccharide biosynthesis protein SpsF
MKIGFLITARLKSTRLPEKLLKSLDDKLIIENVIDRIKEVSSISTIVLCTSINKQDKKLVDVAIENNIYYFNGMKKMYYRDY